MTGECLCGRVKSLPAEGNVSCWFATCMCCCCIRQNWYAQLQYCIPVTDVSGRGQSITFACQRSEVTFISSVIISVSLQCAFVLASTMIRFRLTPWLDTQGSGLWRPLCSLQCPSFEIPIVLPPCGDGNHWCRVVDSNLPAPKDFTIGGNKDVDSAYTIAPFSSILLMGKA